MAFIDQALGFGTEHVRDDMMERQLKDYVSITARLIWQRQSIFFAATTLTAFYFDPARSIACYGAVLFTEVLDLILARRIREWTDHDPAKARRFMAWILANTALSAGAISLFVMVIALQQDVGGHFTPLFFLFAAALFAAMNNHQLVPALALRLTIYGATFFFITFLDIWRVNPPLSSELWLHFFTVVFVLYFIIDCSFMFLQLYRSRLRQLERLREEHARTLAAFEVKSQFVSVVSHELRTPLTSIKGSLDLLNSGALGPVPEAMAPLVDIATKNSARLSNLINDILDFQKIEAGEMTYNFDEVEISRLVTDAIEANRGYADSLGITIRGDLPAGDLVFVQGDESRLMQVMANIISNALKFSHEGGEVIVGYENLGAQVRVFVQDHGDGIPEEARKMVFDRFTQLDSSDQRKVGGTGLGMNISRQIVEQHDGQIDFVSETGIGTTFYVILDVHDPLAEDE
ncbi:MAG: HAMP domain-containing histidine kinase [Rhodobacteraceae bacterium]|nr:HAMP domain-containing histidine kinase [Paracoccaceae bacterium]